MILIHVVASPVHSVFVAAMLLDADIGLGTQLIVANIARDGIASLCFTASSVVLW